MNNNKKARMLNGRQLRDRTGEVLFVDLRRWDENTEEYVIDKGKKKKKTVLTDSQIAAVKRYTTIGNRLKRLILQHTPYLSCIVR